MLTLAQARAAFWTNRQVWPGNYNGHIFLGNAVHLVGMQIYRGKWTGHEASLVNHAPLPPYESADLSAAQILDLRQLLNSAGLAQEITTDTSFMTEREYEMVRQVANVMTDEISERLARWSEAVTTVWKGLISGDVVSVLQSVKGGSFSPPLATTDWIVHDKEVALWRFGVCSLDDGRRFDVTPFNPETHRLIYIVGDSLKAFQEGPLTDLFGKPVVLPGVKASLTPSTVSPPEVRPASGADIKKALARAMQFMQDQGYAGLTREEASTEILSKICKSSRQPIRDIVAGSIPADSRRRTQRQLVNRDRELEDCRRYLTSAA